MQFLERNDLGRLLDALRAHDYEVIGPKIDQEAIVYGSIESVDDLPHGWTEEQSAGKYRLKERDDDCCFGFTVGPHSWKKYLFPPEVRLQTVKQGPRGWEFHDTVPPKKKLAFLGVRACELAAIHIQDRIFQNEDYVDPHYRAHRKRALLIVVQCTMAASTCFCVSMGTGPKAEQGFDLGLTELEHGFLVEVGSDLGAEVIRTLPLRPVTDEERSTAEVWQARARQQKPMPITAEAIRGKLLARLEHPHWQDVAERCLSCANCTLVCPTCFCHSVEEVSDLVHEEIHRDRHWDSCFNPDFSYISGGPIRSTIRARYRQWLTHKLDSWQEQFETSGCVGCGRCITWCPAGIDLRDEVATLMHEDGPNDPTANAKGSEVRS
ncbi:MAG: 4Fe-4S dicluster domain-containing protein [Pirellulales bacterium]